MVDRSNFFFDFGVLILECFYLLPFILQEYNLIGFVTVINAHKVLNILMMIVNVE